MIFKNIDSFDKIMQLIEDQRKFSRLFGKLFESLNVRIKLLWVMPLLSKMAKAQGDKLVKDFILKGLHLIVNLRLALHSQLGYHDCSVVG